MHPYAIDSEERRVVPFFLAVLGILAALGLTRGLGWLSFTLPWWFDAPATMGFYSIFYALFDRWLWRLRLLHAVGVLHAPVLDGHWRGEVVSSFDNRETRQQVWVEIKQRWTKIRIALATEHSRSHSTIAAVSADAPGGPLVTYEYLNEPRGTAAGTMQMHRGVARLRLLDLGTTLEGDYFSGRGRETQGTIHLERHPEDPSHC